jgi:hypothetical protein
MQVWGNIYRWLDTIFISCDDNVQHFNMFGDIAKGDNSKRFQHVIWLVSGNNMKYLAYAKQYYV